MTATTWRRSRALANIGLLAALLSADLVLAQCSAVPLANGTQPAPPANYGPPVGAALRQFKGFADYSDFQISGLRWDHTTGGWTWLACVRFADHGHHRFYAFFLDGGQVTSSRYDVRTDQCPAQQYAPFNPATGAFSAPMTAAPPPGGTPQPSFTLQQPIY